MTDVEELVPKRIYVDTSVYVKILRNEKPQDRLDASLAMMRRVSDRECATWASYLVYAEIFGHGDVRKPRSLEVTEQVDHWFKQNLLFMAEVDARITERARGLAAEHGLRGADAVHLATALLVGCDHFFTWDDGFPIGATLDDQLRIAHPQAWGQGQLGDITVQV